MKSKPGTEVRHFYLTSVFLTIDSWISLNNLRYKNLIIAIISFLIKSLQYFTFLTSNCDKQLQKLTDTQLQGRFSYFSNLHEITPLLCSE